MPCPWTSADTWTTSPFGPAQPARCTGLRLGHVRARTSTGPCDVAGGGAELELCDQRTGDPGGGRASHVTRWHGVEFQRSQPLLDVETKPGTACFRTDGRFLATASSAVRTRVWGLEQGSLPREIAFEERRGFPVAFLEASNHLVTQNGQGGSFREWDQTTGREVRRWQFAGTGSPRKPVISADGRWRFVPEGSDHDNWFRGNVKAQSPRQPASLKGALRPHLSFPGPPLRLAFRPLSHQPRVARPRLHRVLLAARQPHAVVRRNTDRAIQRHSFQAGPRRVRSPVVSGG